MFMTFCKKITFFKPYGDIALQFTIHALNQCKTYKNDISK